MKRLITLLITIIFIFAASDRSFAMCGKCGMGPKKAEVKERDTRRAKDVNNAICPVSGEKIDEETKATYEHEGKIYNFCCAMCIDEFKNDSEKYIKKVEEELQAQNKEKKKMQSHMHKEHN